MQKLSETLYSNLFWLISGLVVWLVIIPVTLICFPVIILVKMVGQLLFRMAQSNLVEAQRRSPTHPETQPVHAIDRVVTILLLKTLIEVPALLAAVISLQPERLMKDELGLTQTLQPQPTNSSGESTSESIDITTEEKTRGT